MRGRIGDTPGRGYLDSINRLAVKIEELKSTDFIQLRERMEGVASESLHILRDMDERIKRLEDRYG